MSEPVRLQKYIAQCGICSRRKAEEYIQAGRIQVDGILVTQPGIKVTPGVNQVSFDGKRIVKTEKQVYYLLNKPKGYVTTVSDPQGRPTVLSFFGKVIQRLFPVGRLDLDSEGALLMTNDGELAQKILHPRFEVTKTYEVEVAGSPQPQSLRSLERGFLLEGKQTAPAKVRFLRKMGRSSLMEITIHEGRKHQVKKMFRHFGHPVFRLKRTAYGKLTLNGLKSGNYRQLRPEDLKKIFF